jgi:hypothetical protein
MWPELQQQVIVTECSTTESQISDKIHGWKLSTFVILL